MNLMKFIKISLVIIIVVFTIFFFSVFTTIDKTPYQETVAYKTTMTRIEALPSSEIDTNNIFLAGWSKQNLLPPFSTPIAIDAARGGKHFESVRDSIYVSSFVFKLGETKVAYISADLLIIPPLVVQIVDSLLANKGFTKENIYYTATHTHTSIGAWHNSFVGEIFAGKFDARIPLHIANSIATSIENAENNLSHSKVGSLMVPAHKLVVNRLVGNEGLVDSTMRMLKIENELGEEALIFSFTAHATIFHEEVMHISGDWPSETILKLQKMKPNIFTVFSAGAVGSHGPFEHSKNQTEELEYISENASKILIQYIDSVELLPIQNLKMHYLPIETRKPHFRVANNLAIRPFWFTKLFGEAKLHVNLLEIGNNFMVGMPCDFSGELTYEIEPLVQLKGKQLFITSFNGAYAGYITRDTWYELNEYETRTMAWLGRGNGNYFSEIVMQSAAKIFE